MREELEKLGNDKRHTFTGKFERFGLKHGYMGPVETVLLIDIRLAETNEQVADHLWFNKTKGFTNANLKEGDIVQFDGRVAQYTKGYFGRRDNVYIPFSTDLKIERPTNVTIITNK